MSPWRARLAVLAVFLTGFACGAAALDAVRLRIENRVLASPDLVPRIGVYLLDQDLDLNAGQRQAIHDVIERPRGQIVAVLRPVIPDLIAITDRMENEIRAVLDEKQRDRFGRIVAHRRVILEKILETPGTGKPAPP